MRQEINSLPTNLSFIIPTTSINIDYQHPITTIVKEVESNTIPIVVVTEGAGTGGVEGAALYCLCMT